MNEQTKFTQNEFGRAFRNYFTNEDAVKRITQLIGDHLNVEVMRPQAQKLLEELWSDKKIRNKQHFHELTDEEILKWVTHFVHEHKGKEVEGKHKKKMKHMGVVEDNE